MKLKLKIEAVAQELLEILRNPAFDERWSVCTGDGIDWLSFSSVPDGESKEVVVATAPGLHRWKKIRIIILTTESEGIKDQISFDAQIVDMLLFRKLSNAAAEMYERILKRDSKESESAVEKSVDGIHQVLQEIKENETGPNNNG